MRMWKSSYVVHVSNISFASINCYVLNNHVIINPYCDADQGIPRRMISLSIFHLCYLFQQKNRYHYRQVYTADITMHRFHNQRSNHHHRSYHISFPTIILKSFKSFILVIKIIKIYLNISLHIHSININELHKLLKWSLKRFHYVYIDYRIIKKYRSSINIIYS